MDHVLSATARRTASTIFRRCARAAPRDGAHDRSLPTTCRTPRLCDGGATRIGSARKARRPIVKETSVCSLRSDRTRRRLAEAKERLLGRCILHNSVGGCRVSVLRQQPRKRPPPPPAPAQLMRQPSDCWPMAISADELHRSIKQHARCARKSNASSPRCFTRATHGLTRRAASTRALIIN